MSLLHIFAANVRRIRQQQKLSQEKLAEKSGLHRTYISALERGTRNISIDNIQKISEALDVDASILFQEEQDKVTEQ